MVSEGLARPEAQGNGTLADEIRALRAEIRALHASISARRRPRLVDNSESILTAHQLAEMLQVSTATISRYRKLGMPVLSRTDGMVRFRYGDVLAWLQTTKRRPR